MVKVWFQRGKNTSERIKIRPDSDIDGLKQEIFGRADKEKYQAAYKGQVLTPSAKVPHSTTDALPIVFTAIGDGLTPSKSQSYNQKVPDLKGFTSDGILCMSQRLFLLLCQRWKWNTFLSNDSIGVHKVRELF